MSAKKYGQPKSKLIEKNLLDQRILLDEFIYEV